MADEKVIPLKMGYHLLIVPGDPPKVQVIAEEDRSLVFEGILLPYGRRKIARRWLALNYLYLEASHKFARNGKEAAEQVEKKLTESWGNPFAVDFPDWAVKRG
jgi:hypothetical protein